MGLVLYEPTASQYLADIRRYGDPNYVDGNGMPSLCQAIYKYRSLSLVEELVKDGADVNKPMQMVTSALRCHKELGENLFPIHLAVASRQLEIARLLLDYGADPNAKTSKGIGLLQTLLDKKKRFSTQEQLPSEERDLELLKLLVRNGAEINNVKGTPLLHYAVRDERHNVARCLISLGCSVNVSSYGETPLHISTTAECTTILLENNANPNAQDNAGKTPLHYTTADGRTKCIELLLQHNADPNITDNSGKTPLHCSSNNIECARVLLQHSADPNVQDKSGKTVYHYVVENISDENKTNQAEFILMLHDYHIDSSICDDQGKTALFYLGSSHPWENSAFEVVLPMLTELKELEKVVLKRDIGGEPFIHALLKRCSDWEDSSVSNFEGIVAFIAAMPEADINIRDFQNRTALHLFAAGGNWDFAQVLLQYGADMNAKDCEGNTPLHIAIQCKRWEVAKNLLCYWTKPTKADQKQIEKNESPHEDIPAGKRSNSLPNLLWTPKTFSLFESLFCMEDHYSSFSMLKDNKFESKFVEYVSALPTPTMCKVLTDRIRSTSLLETCKENSVGHFHLIKKCDEEKCLIVKQVFQLVTDLVEKCQELDPRFECNLLLTGSSAEGTKMWVPDEFDFMMELTQLKGRCFLNCLHSPRVIVRNDHQLLWTDLLIQEGSSELSPKKIKDYMKSLLLKASPLLDQNKYQNICFSLCEYNLRTNFMETTKVGLKLTFYWLGKTYKKLLINVDLTPAIPFTLNEKFRLQLCQRSRDRELGDHFHILPETSSKKDWCYPGWRVSFSRAELRLIHTMSPKQLSLYKCLKFLRDIHVINATDFPSYYLKCFTFDFVFGNEYIETESFNSIVCQALRQLHIYSNEDGFSSNYLENFFLGNCRQVNLTHLDMRWCVTALDYLGED